MCRGLTIVLTGPDCHICVNRAAVAQSCADSVLPRPAATSASSQVHLGQDNRQLCRSAPLLCFKGILHQHYMACVRLGRGQYADLSSMHEHVRMSVQGRLPFSSWLAGLEMRTLRQDRMAGSSDLAALFWMAEPRVPFRAKWLRAVAVAFSWGTISSIRAWLKSPCTREL